MGSRKARDRPKLVEFAPWQLDSSARDQERLFPPFPLQKRRNLGALLRKVSSWDRSVWDDPQSSPHCARAKGVFQGLKVDWTHDQRRRLLVQVLPGPLESIIVSPVRRRAFDPAPREP